jgi:hypothetical protein
MQIRGLLPPDKKCLSTFFPYLPPKNFHLPSVCHNYYSLNMKTLDTEINCKNQHHFYGSFLFVAFFQRQNS